MARPRIKSQTEALAIAQEYVTAVRQSGVPVERAWLFGSFAKNKQHTWSDVDIAVISSRFGRDRFEERKQLMLLCHSISSAIEPHPFHPDAINNRWDSLAAEIKTHGIPVPEA